MVAMSFNILVVLLSGVFLFRHIWKKMKDQETFSQKQETMKMKSMNEQEMDINMVGGMRTQEEINEEVQQKRKDWREKLFVFFRVLRLILVPFIDSILGKFLRL